MADLPDNSDTESEAEGVDERDERPGEAPAGLSSFRIATYNVNGINPQGLAEA